MVREYLTTLEKEYNYTGNWQPDRPVKIGSCIPLETSFIEWLKNILGIRGRVEKVNESLQQLDITQINHITTRRTKRSPIQLEHEVKTQLSVQNNAIQVEAAACSDNGFLILLDRVWDVTLSKSTINETLKDIKDSCAIVAGVTYAEGLISVFRDEKSSLTLSGPQIMLPKEFSELRAASLNVTHECNGAILFRSTPQTPLVPFLNLLIVEKVHHCGLKGMPDKQITLNCSPFSYMDFINCYEDRV